MLPLTVAELGSQDSQNGEPLIEASFKALVWSSADCFGIASLPRTVAESGSQDSQNGDPLIEADLNTLA